MKLFFLVLEAFIYAYAFYLLVKKKDLALVYLPVLFFANIVITPVAPAILFYGTISLLLLSIMVRNSMFLGNNIFAFLITVYFLLLLPKSKDLAAIRPFVFGVIWFFLSVPLINAIYQKHSREVIFKELSNAALLILLIFNANVVVSSFFKYSPHAMYGITSGVLYGNLFAVDFNILPIAVFITALSVMKEKSALRFVVLMVAFCFIMLTLRRSVMGLSAAGIGFAFLISMAQKNAQRVLAIGSLVFLVGYLVVANTSFLSLFNERYEMRNLDDRALEEEKRFIEYELLYKDMFVYHDYSPWFGYELFNSWGNYGRGVLGDRSLHSDITNITHASGLIGLSLYLLLVFTAFRQAYRRANTNTEKLSVFFCAMTFLAFTTTGRYTETGYMMFLFLLLLLPLSEEAETEKETQTPVLNLSNQVPV